MWGRPGRHGEGGSDGAPSCSVSGDGDGDGDGRPGRRASGSRAAILTPAPHRFRAAAMPLREGGREEGGCVFPQRFSGGDAAELAGFAVSARVYPRLGSALSVLYRPRFTASAALPLSIAEGITVRENFRECRRC